MRCPCGSGTPAPYWSFCEACALQRCRALMSPVPILAPTVARRHFARLDRVLFDGRAGRVVRADRRVGGQYVVDLDDGERVYVPPDALTLRSAP